MPVILEIKIMLVSIDPAGIYLLKVDNRNT